MQHLSAILGLKSEPLPSGKPRPAGPDVDAIAAVMAEAAAPFAAVAASPLRRVGFAVVIGLSACATASSPGMPAASPEGPTPEARALAFTLDAPDAETLGRPLRLWATHYHTPSVAPAAETISAAFPLIGRDGAWISPPLSQRDWCEAALQGSVSVRTGATATAYAFVDANGPEQANCDQWLGNLSDGVKTATRRARFMQVSHPLGCGVRDHPLAPYRTLAVDPDTIPIDSVIFVPELRGRAFRHDGRDLVHDGYLFAGDRGGAIKGAHVDVFLEEASAGPFEDLFASTAARPFDAHILPAGDPAARAIRATQSGRCADVTPG